MIAERDEARESKEIYMKQLEECQLRIKQLEDERGTEDMQSDTSSVSELDDPPLSLHSTQKSSNHEGDVMEKVEGLQENDSSRPSNNGKNSAYTITDHDSGIEIDIDAVTREIKEQVDILVNEKLNDLGIKQNTEKYSTVLVKNTKAGLVHTNSNRENIRDLNIIIHGIDESETSDDLFIKELLGIMEVKRGSIKTDQNCHGHEGAQGRVIIIIIRFVREK